MNNLEQINLCNPGYHRQQYQSYLMHNPSLERVNCISLRAHKNDLLQQLQNEAKAYRSLLFLYSQHLNGFIKANRDCLADIDYYPRLKMNRQEQIAIEENMDKIYLKSYDRISKEGISRNSFTRKNYEEFARQYQEFFPVEILQHREEMADSKIIQTIEQDKYVCKRTLSNKKIGTASTSTAIRPLTSKGYAKNRGYGCSTQTNNFSMSCKMKSVSAYASGNPEVKADGEFSLSINGQWPRQCSKNTKRFFFQGQKKGDEGGDSKQYNTPQQFIFNGSEILINDHKRYPSTIFKDKKSLGMPTQKIGMKKLLTMKFAQRKSIDQIEKMQIQNRIMMANSVLAVNLPTSQGYRPKSRCWQNYFN